MSLWARRGGTKCRKNSPQVTVFSQSGEVAMLRAGQALATWQSPGREMSETNTRQPARPRWLTAERSEPSGRMRGIEPYNKIIVVFPSSVLPSRCFGNPPSPEGEGLIGCVHVVISSAGEAEVEKSHTIETARCIYAPAKCPHGHRASPAATHRPDLPLIGRCATAPPPRGSLNRSRTRIPQILARTVTVPRPRRPAAQTYP